MTPAALAALAAAAFAGGAVNAVAGGGTLIAFPAALAVGLSPLTANATNAVAMAPAALASAWAYRREVREEVGLVRVLALPALLGGAAGSVLLLSTPPGLFARIVPGFVLAATMLLLVQNLRTPPRAEDAPPASPRARMIVSALTFLVSVYGGYFGAGMGLLMLATFGLLGPGDTHRRNGLRSVLGALVNGVAAVFFVASGSVDAPAALVMAVSASLGGWGGAWVLRRVPARAVRWIIVALGAVLTVVLATRLFAVREGGAEQRFAEPLVALGVEMDAVLPREIGTQSIGVAA